MKRQIQVEGTDLVLDLGKVSVVDTPRNFIYFEEMKDGSWRLTYTKSLIPDITQVEGFKIVRHN